MSTAYTKNYFSKINKVKKFINLDSDLTENSTALICNWLKAHEKRLKKFESDIFHANEIVDHMADRRNLPNFFEHLIAGIALEHYFYLRSKPFLNNFQYLGYNINIDFEQSKKVKQSHDFYIRGYPIEFKASFKDRTSFDLRLNKNLNKCKYIILFCLPSKSFYLIDPKGGETKYHFLWKKEVKTFKDLRKIDFFHLMKFLNNF